MEMNERDRLIWKQAKKRVGFRRHLTTYLLVNGFLWALWLFSGREADENGFPWPLWATLGWGFGLAFNFYHAYLDNKVDAVEREYEKLKNSGK
jgi:hypothetical protein